jgi:F-type H+-transporting ATPase subunit a
VAGLVDQVMGHGSQKYVPLIGAIFVYILFNNFFGLVPGVTPATENLNTTLAAGLSVFVLYNAFGLKENGIGYLKHFLGPLIWLAPLMLPIELISHLVRPASLGLRLMGNMTGDHTVLGIFLNLVPIGVPIIFYVLGMFVCFVQAFVFSLLSMVYISLATAHDH